MREILLPLTAALTLSPCLAHGAPDSAPPSVRPGTPAQPSASGPAATLTLSQAIELALANHPDLAAARSDVAATEAAQMQASARPNPVVEAELEDTRRETRSTTLLITQPIELWGKRAARMDAADRAQVLALSRQASLRTQLRADVTAAFIDVLTAQEHLWTVDGSLEIAQRATAATGRRVSAGKVSPIEETKARVAEADVRVERIQAAGTLRVALQALQAMLGGSRVVSSVDGSVALPSVPPESDMQLRLADAPTLRQAQLEAERLGALARLERARRIPDVSVGVGMKRSQELGRNQALFALSIPLPVLDTNRGAELEALRREDKARHEVEATALRLQADATRELEGLRSALAEADALQNEILPGAQAAYDATSKGFELGKFGFLEVLDTQRTLLDARTRRLRAVAQAHRFASALDRLLGDPSHSPTDTTPAGQSRETR